MSSQGGRGGGQKLPILPSKKTTKRGEEVKKRRFWDDVVYGRPLTLKFLYLLEHFLSSTSTNKIASKPQNSLIVPSNGYMGWEAVDKRFNPNGMRTEWIWNKKEIGHMHSVHCHIFSQTSKVCIICSVSIWKYLMLVNPWLNSDVFNKKLLVFVGQGDQNED